MECSLSRYAGDHRRRGRANARGLSRFWRALLWCASVLVAWASPVIAAPPGALRLDRGRFTVIHYRDDATLARAALDAAASRDTFPWLPRASTRIVIMVAPDAATFREWAGQGAASWAAAVAFPDQHRVVVQGGKAPADAGDPTRVLRHELAHVALHDYLGDLAPRWFDEGYASYAAGEERMDGFVSTNLALIFRGMPALATLDAMIASPRPTEARAGYALALRAVSDLAAIDTDRGLGPMFVAWKERGSLDLAMRRAFALTSDDFQRGWQQRARWQFAFLALAADSAITGSVLLLGLWPMYRRRRLAQRDRLEAMRAREAITESSARSAALDALLHSIGPDRPRAGPDAGPDA